MAKNSAGFRVTGSRCHSWPNLFGNRGYLSYGALLVHRLEKHNGQPFEMLGIMQPTNATMMSDEDFVWWKKMRKDISEKNFLHVDEIIKINQGEIDFAVLPAKPEFAKGESVLAEMRITNGAQRILHVNEPKLLQMVLPHEYKGGQKGEFRVTLSPFESTWMKTLKPGEKLALPIIIPVGAPGKQRAVYTLVSSQFANAAGKKAARHDTRIAVFESEFGTE